MEKDFRFLIYKSEEEEVSINAVVKDESVWLTQKGMAELFAVEVPAISKHLSNIYSEGELTQDATISKMEIVQIEVNKTSLSFYCKLIFIYIYYGFVMLNRIIICNFCSAVSRLFK